MKRISLLLVAALLAGLFSGCSILTGAVRRVLNLGAARPTATAAATVHAPTAEPTREPAPEPTGQSAAPAGAFEEVVSACLGVAFDVPSAWSGKYRVEEGDNYLAVYFRPSAPIAEGVGNLFSIVLKTSEEDAYMLDNSVEIAIDGETYIFGTPTDVPYQQQDPEYDAFVAMLKDLPAICASVRASGR